MVDVGMANNYQVKIEANAVFVRARKKNPAPTPILIRHGSNYWMGRLVYSANPVLKLYDFKGATLASGTTGQGASGSLTGNPLALSAPIRREEVERKLSRLGQEKEEHRAVAVVGNGLVLSLANVRNDKKFTYLRLKVINRTNIDYLVDITDFQLVENAKGKFLGKKKNQARRPLAPAGGEANQNIEGRSTGYLTYAIPLYAATNDGYLEVTLRELHGARVLVLPIPSRLINRAKTI
nr:DUF4138 domain-containing protein [Rufibacter tibetensis]